MGPAVAVEGTTVREVLEAYFERVLALPKSFAVRRQGFMRLSSQLLGAP
jgi:hypothetical protein